MRYSELFISTLKEDPAEAELISHKLMVRSGMIRKLATGIYSYLPVGLKVIKKVENIIREEMNAGGAQEVLLPVLSPAQLWQESGRWALYGEELMRLKDRHQRDFCLGPTHEEVITDLVRQQVRSYRQLPVNLYQIQTKFRDEIRPRFGLMRGREFIMKDGYSFDRDEKGVEVTYQKMYQAYSRIFQRCGLRFKAVEADTGTIGGNFSHEFMVLASSGEEEVVSCRQCSYAVNADKAECRPPQTEPPAFPYAREEAHTPGLKSVSEVAVFLNKPVTAILKTLIIQADNETVLVLLRGDHELHPEKLRKHLNCHEIALADEETVRRVTKAPVGFASPVGIDIHKVIADLTVETMGNFVCGANVEDYHLTDVNWGRDFHIDQFVDIRRVSTQDTCPLCGSGLEINRGIEVGHIFKLGTKYSKMLNATYLDESGQSQIIVMGCYGIGVGRTVAAAIEQNHDQNGIIWPQAIAPYQVLLLPLDVQDKNVLTLVENLYTDLKAAGVEVLLDDREERPGAKFKDADLLGIPLRVNIGARDLAKNQVEIKIRRSGEIFKLVPDDVKNKLMELLGNLS